MYSFFSAVSLPSIIATIFWVSISTLFKSVVALMVQGTSNPMVFFPSIISFSSSAIFLLPAKMLSASALVIFIAGNPADAVTRLNVSSISSSSLLVLTPLTNNIPAAFLSRAVRTFSLSPPYEINKLLSLSGSGSALSIITHLPSISRFW